MHHNSKAAHLTRSECEGFKRCCLSRAVDETNVDMEVKRMGMLGAGAKKMKAPTVKMERVKLTGKGRQNLTGFVY